jgi:23S rRNA U2552 (ribose-2'-O)-methylase RlmE/FtsJ
MEVIILKKNEIINFENQIPYKTITFNEYSDLKLSIFGNFQDLDKSKGNIDSLNKESEKFRRAAAKYLHEYELVKNICKKQVISRAYFKLYEIIYFEPIILSNNLSCFFICEAPGGFIECVNDIRRKKNLRTEYFSVSKADQYIKYDRYLEESCLMYSDITCPENLENIINKVHQRFPNKLDLITADGGFDIKQFNAQEILSSHLLICEIYLAVKCQKVGGMFIIKFFDMFSHNSVVYYLILCSMYRYVKIIKPKTSRNCNSERYLVCYHFTGNINNDLLGIISNFTLNSNKISIVYPEYKFNEQFTKKLSTFNNLIVYEQVKTINESIRMVQSKDLYFQNLLLNLFTENKGKKTSIVHYFKGILTSRIKKCTDFLRLYNINTNQIIKYQF